MSNLIGGEEVAHIEALASMDNWEQFMEFASDQIDQAIPDQSQSYKLKLAYEELISNIIRATNKDLLAGTTPASLEILALKNVWDGHNVFVLRTQDTGPHFDPHFADRDSVDINQPVHERQIGGLGLFLIQQSVDYVAYDWIDEKNTYDLCMKI